VPAIVATLSQSFNAQLAPSQSAHSAFAGHEAEALGQVEQSAEGVGQLPGQGDGQLA